MKVEMLGKEHEIEMMPDRLLVEQMSQDDTTKGGIIIPNASEKKLNEAFVHRAGPASEGEDWKGHNFEGGEYIMFQPVSALAVEVGGKNLLIIHRVEVLAVIGKK